MNTRDSQLRRNVEQLATLLEGPLSKEWAKQPFEVRKLIISGLIELVHFGKSLPES